MLKIVVVGDLQTGKTSILRSFIQNQFDKNYRPTIGANFFQKSVLIHGSDLNLQFWDITGQERIAKQTSFDIYLRGCVGAVIVEDYSNFVNPEMHKASLETLYKWRQILKDKTSLPNGDPIPVVVCLNKSDLSNQSNQQIQITQDLSSNELQRQNSQSSAASSEFHQKFKIEAEYKTTQSSSGCSKSIKDDQIIIIESQNSQDQIIKSTQEEAKVQDTQIMIQQNQILKINLDNQQSKNTESNQILLTQSDSSPKCMNYDQLSEILEVEGTFQTSAKLGINIKQSIGCLVKHIIKLGLQLETSRFTYKSINKNNNLQQSSLFYLINTQ